MPELNEQSVDDEILSDWKAIQAKQEPEEAEPVEAKEEPKVEAVKTEEKPEVKDERPRDESGKFVKAKEPEDKPPVKTEAKPELKTEAKPETEAQPRDVTRPPSSWKPTAREEWAKLPDSVRAEIHRRESDFMNGQSQLLPDARLGASMRQTIEPYRMLIEAEGGTPERAVGQLLRTAAVLRMGTPDQRAQAVMGIAQQFGVDLSKAIGGQPQQQASPQQFQDPRVDGLLQSIQQQQTQQTERERSERESAAGKWMAEADPQGNPLRPYVNDVMPEMTALVPQIRQMNPGFNHSQVLQEAYDRATWAHPEIRSLLQAKQTEELRRRTENQQRVTEAKKATSTNVPRRGSTPSPGKPGRMEDTISETARALGLIN